MHLKVYTLLRPFHHIIQLHSPLHCSKAATRGVLCKKVLLEISRNSQENTCAKETLVQVFPVNFVKFLRTPFLQNNSGRLLLFCYNHKKDEITSTLQRYLCEFVSFRKRPPRGASCTENWFCCIFEKFLANYSLRKYFSGFSSLQL